MPDVPRHTVLVTGSAGAVGRVAARALLEAGHRVRGFDRVASDSLDDQVVADLTDLGAVRRAVAGVDRVVHLAAYPNPAPFVDVLVGPNVVGLYHVVTAAVEAGVARLVLASSIQVVGRDARQRYEPDPIPTTHAEPWNDYALTKLFAEQLGRMTARQHPVEVIAARIGWFVRNAAEAQRLRERGGAGAYLAPTDAAQFFRRAVEAPKLETPDRYATLYAVGPGTPAHPTPFDLEPGRRLIGYEPRIAWPDEAP